MPNQLWVEQLHRQARAHAERNYTDPSWRHRQHGLPLVEICWNAGRPRPHGLTENEISSIAEVSPRPCHAELYEWLLMGAQPELAADLAEKAKPWNSGVCAGTIPTVMLARNVRVQEHHLQPVIDRELFVPQLWQETRAEMATIDTTTRVSPYARLASDLLTELGTKAGLWMLFFDLWDSTGGPAEDALMTVRATL